MHGKQKIIDDVLATAKRTAESMLEEARSEADTALAELRSRLAAAQNRALERTNSEADALYAGQVKLGDLEAGKALLKARQQCVASVYDGVRQKILSAPDAEYLALLKKLIVANASDGDIVIASHRDGKRVTDEWVKKVATSAKIKLTLSKTKGEFDGGVVLSNSVCDKDLSVDEIVSELKERTVADTVKKLGL